MSRLVAARRRELLGQQTPDDESPRLVPEVWPEVPEPLVRHLESLYPQRCMTIGETEAEHRHYAGMAELVTIMRGVYDRQQRAPDDAAEVEVDIDTINREIEKHFTTREE